MEFLNKNILVVGFGKSGLSVSRYLLSRGAYVTINDLKPEGDLDRKLLTEAKDLGARFETGEHRIETFLGSDMIIVSPGVPLDIEGIRAARSKKVPVLGELELAFRLIKSPVIAVTGTNGKTTSVSLLGAIMEKAGLKIFMGGNIGTPLMDFVLTGNDVDYVLAEVSSFQLDTIEEFRPDVSLILNISPDHLDRYPDYESYARSKLKIFKNQSAGQYAILNDDDERLSRVNPGGEVNVLRYGLERRKGRSAFFNGREVIIDISGREERAFGIEDFNLPGRHNLENLMAVLLAAFCIGIDKNAVERSVREFRGLPHRMEYSGNVNGVDFYDDSKATNVDAASKSVGSFDRPVVLIAGGIDKGGSYGPLVETAKGHVKKAIFLGEARTILAESFEGIVPYAFAASMEDAVNQAFKAAAKNDAVLLAPACSSFDMFIDYAQRGRAFVEAVRRLDDGF